MDASQDTNLCVHCRQRAVSAAWRPFCSERCKLLDLGEWLQERHRVPGQAYTPEDRDPDEDEDEHL